MILCSRFSCFIYIYYVIRSRSCHRGLLNGILYLLLAWLNILTNNPVAGDIGGDKTPVKSLWWFTLFTLHNSPDRCYLVVKDTVRAYVLVGPCHALLSTKLIHMLNMSWNIVCSFRHRNNSGQQHLFQTLETHICGIEYVVQMSQLS